MFTSEDQQYDSWEKMALSGCVMRNAAPYATPNRLAIFGMPKPPCLSPNKTYPGDVGLSTEILLLWAPKTRGAVFWRSKGGTCNLNRDPLSLA